MKIMKIECWVLYASIFINFFVSKIWIFERNFLFLFLHVFIDIMHYHALMVFLGLRTAELFCKNPNLYNIIVNFKEVNVQKELKVNDAKST